MKKTLSITLGGRAYMVEEDAYDALNGYVNKIRAQFKDDPTVDELVADMEAGMADVFEKQQGKRKGAALTLADVEAMMTVMGAPEEIADEEPPASDAKGGATGAKESHGARAGDSSGPKRLYRNPDDTVVAGVCSGIAAYLGIDPVIVRIAFIILSFINGIGILAYIVFWIAMPEAQTSAQKLEMRGKPVNLAEIEELVKEKAEKMSAEGKKTWARMQDKKSPLRRFLEVPVRMVGACARVALQAATILVKVLGAIVGVAFGIAGAVSAAAVTMAAAVMLFGVQSPYIQSDLPLQELVGEPRYYIGVVAAYVAVIIPLVFLVKLGSLFMGRRNLFHTGPLIAMTVLWFAALSTAAAMGTHLAPWAQTRLAEIDAAQTVRQDVMVPRDIHALLASGDVRVTVMQGDAPSLVLIGREEDLTRATTTVEDGQLNLRLDDPEERRVRVCLFCHGTDVRAELVLPSFTQVEVTDAARVAATVEDADALRVAQSDRAHVTLEGTVQALTVTLEDAATLSADDLHAETVNVTAIDYGRARVRTTGTLTAMAQDAARIVYRGNPATTTIQELDYGRVTNGYEE